MKLHMMCFSNFICRLVSLSGAGALGNAAKPLGTTDEDETIHMVDSGHQGEVPTTVTVIQDPLGTGTSLIGTLPASSLGAGDAPCTVSIPIVSVPSTISRVSDTIGSVPGSIGNVTECLRIVQSSDSLGVMTGLPCTSTETVSLSRVASSSIAGLQDALQNVNATIGPISTISQDGISALNAQGGTTTLQDLEGVVVTSSAGSDAATLRTLTLTDSGVGVAGTLGTETDVVGSLAAGTVPVETVSLVNISVPNVELTTSGKNRGISKPIVTFA